MKLTRRTLLRGLSGLSISLPWLEATAEAKSKMIPNFAFLFMPNGVHPHKWTPQGIDEAYSTSSILKPLEPLRSEFDILTNLCHHGARKGDGHYAKTANFLSGAVVKKTTGKHILSGTSADQVIAQRIGNRSPLASIELGIEPTRTGIDSNVGFTQVYGGHISWSSATTPLPKEIYPQLAFDRLFSKQTANPQLQSVLDDIKNDASQINKYLGREDKARMDEFYTSLRSLEKRIALAKHKNYEHKVDIPHKLRPSQGLPHNLQEHMILMLDIITLAFKMNRTQVASFMFGNAVSGKNFSFLKEVEGGFHQLSHHQNNKEKMNMYAAINTFHMQMFGHFLKKMKSVKQGDKSLLDNSLIMIGSGLRDGNQHSPVNLPILIAGKGGENFKRGRHRILPKNTPLCNVLLGFIDKAGIPQEQFGDSTHAII